MGGRGERRSAARGPIHYQSCAPQESQPPSAVERHTARALTFLSLASEDHK